MDDKRTLKGDACATRCTGCCGIPLSPPEVVSAEEADHNHIGRTPYPPLQGSFSRGNNRNRHSRGREAPHQELAAIRYGALHMSTMCQFQIETRISAYLDSHPSVTRCRVASRLASTPRGPPSWTSVTATSYTCKPPASFRRRC